MLKSQSVSFVQHVQPLSSNLI